MLGHVENQMSTSNASVKNEKNYKTRRKAEKEKRLKLSSSSGTEDKTTTQTFSGTNHKPTLIYTRLFKLLREA